MATDQTSTDGWEEVGNSGESETWDKTGTLIGVFKRHKTNVGPNESNVYEIEATVDGEPKLYSVWGSSVLDSKFEQIDVGSIVKIEALGKAKSPKTGRTYNDFKISVKPVDSTVKDIMGEGTERVRVA